MTQTISGNNPEHHFAGAGKPITGGKGAVQIVQDYQPKRGGNKSGAQ